MDANLCTNQRTKHSRCSAQGNGSSGYRGVLVRRSPLNGTAHQYVGHQFVWRLGPGGGGSSDGASEALEEQG